MSTTYGVAGITGWAGLTAASQNKQSGEMDKQAFLKLLITQLSMQDPLKPMADHAYIAQLAQFSSLEQMAQMNSGMAALRTSVEEGQLKQTALSALSLLGRNVSMRGADGLAATGTIDAVRLLGATVLLRLAGKEYTLDQVQEVTAV